MPDISNMLLNGTQYDFKDKNMNNNFIKFKTITRNMTVPANSYIQGNFGNVQIPNGFRLLSVLPYSSFCDRFLVSFGIGEQFNGSRTSVDIYHVIENKFNQSISQNITAIAVLINKNYFNNNNI